MRREVAVLVVMAGLGLSLWSCEAPPGPAPVVRCPDGQKCMALPAGDEVAGCDANDPEKGASLVKIKIKIKPGDDGDGCIVDKVRPKRVCVHQGGVVRWKVDNNCDAEVALNITGIGWLDEVCDPKIKVPANGPDKKRELLCSVPDVTPVEHYEYNVEVGGGDGFDPWIEVKRGG